MISALISEIRDLTPDLPGLMVEGACIAVFAAAVLLWAGVGAGAI